MALVDIKDKKTIPKRMYNFNGKHNAQKTVHKKLQPTNAIHTPTKIHLKINFPIE